MSRIPKTIGLAFNIGGLVAPDNIAGNLAKFFLTPIPRMAESQFPAELSDLAVESTHEVAGHPVKAWTFGQSDRRLLFCHGWGGCGANAVGLLPGLIEAGFEVHVFDGPAHGAGKQRATNMLEFGELFNILIAENGPFSAAIGHSFGGGAITLALGRGLDVDSVVLIAPMINSESATNYFLEQLQIRRNLRERVHRRLQEMFSENIDAWNLAESAKSYSTAARIFHDPQDPRVPYEAAEEAANNWQNCQIVPKPGLGHQKILSDPTVVEEVIDFVSTVKKVS